MVCVPINNCFTCTWHIKYLYSPPQAITSPLTTLLILIQLHSSCMGLTGLRGGLHDGRGVKEGSWTIWSPRYNKSPRDTEWLLPKFPLVTKSVPRALKTRTMKTSMVGHKLSQPWLPTTKDSVAGLSLPVNWLEILRCLLGIAVRIVTRVRFGSQEF